MSDQKFLTPRKAAEELQISYSTIRRMIKQGTCPGFYSGNRFMVNLTELTKSLGTQTAEEPEIQKVVVTVEEMAKMLGISRPTAYELTKKEGFPAIRVSDRLIIIPMERLQKWLNEVPTVSEECKK